MSDSQFDSVWRAFADADARVRAPDRIRDTVMAAWDAPRGVPEVVRSHDRHVVRPALAVAATVAITAAVFQVPGSQLQVPGSGFGHSKFPVPRSAVSGSVVPGSAVPDSAGRLEEPARVAAVANSVSIGSSPLSARRRARVIRDVTPRDVPSTGGPAALVALTGEPALTAEPLQLVRLRVPRTSLRAFGVALIDPDASGLVDVDLVVGSDGLPRDIRRVRPVVDIHVAP